MLSNFHAQLQRDGTIDLHIRVHPSARRTAVKGILSDGSIKVDLAAVPLADRLPCAPVGVLQRNNIMDTNGCASRAPLNALETKLTYLYTHGLDPWLRQWLRDKGYIQNGKVVLNDAFIEILSGTARDGNSLKAPVDAIYRFGVIPAHYLPLEDGMTWDEYMNPARITQEMRDLGQQFLLRFGINYEKVTQAEMADAIEDDLLSVGLHAWPLPVNGVYPANEGQPNHAVCKVTNSIHILDNYVPFTKLLAPDYKTFDWGWSISITRLTPDPVQELGRLAKILQDILTWLKIKRGIIGVWK